MFDSYVAFWARVKPQALAIAMLGPGITYAQFDRDIDRFAVGLEALDMPARGVVGLRLRSPYAHWLAVMALARLRVASASIPLRDRSAAEVIAAVRPSLLLSDTEADHATRVVVLSSDWITATLRKETAGVGERSCDAESIGRVSTSSGTTGVPKAMAFSWRKIIERAQRRALLDRSPDDTALVLGGNDTNFGFSQRVATWLAGAALVIGPDLAQLPSAFASLRPTVLTLSAGYLQVLVDALPESFQAIPSLRVHVGGAAVSPNLLRRTRLRLSSNVQVKYSSSECGAAARGPASLVEQYPGFAGYKLPWADIEVLDPAGAPCAAGVEGEVRIRSVEMVDSYYGDSRSSATALRDGWFYPGDVGAVMADGAIVITGRIDELINLGGMKVAPHVIEDVLRASPGVADCAVFALDRPEGSTALWAAVVRTAQFSQTDLPARLRAAVPKLPRLHVTLTDAIPRNDRGKPDLRRLRELATAAHASPADV